MITHNNVEYYAIEGFDGYFICKNSDIIKFKDGVPHRFIKQTTNGSGYLCVHLRRDDKQYCRYVHRLLAITFLDLDEDSNLTVDHINHDRRDNRLENLRLVSQSDNLRNKTSSKNIVYKYYDELPEKAIPFEDFNGHAFTNYFIYKRRLYYYTGEAYRRLEPTSGNKLFLINDEKRKVGITASKINQKDYMESHEEEDDE